MLACLGRCVERCAGFRLQELVARKEIDIVDLQIDKKLAKDLQRATITSHNQNIASQFTKRNGDEIVDDTSITQQSQIEMSNTESLPLNTSQDNRSSKKRKLFSSLDILEDHRSTIVDDDDNEDVIDDNNGNNNHLNINLIDNDDHDSLMDDRDNDDLTDEDDDDLEPSEHRQRSTDVLEVDFYESMKSKTTATTSTDKTQMTVNESLNDNNKNLKAIHEKHSLKGDLLRFEQERNRGDSGQRRKFSL